MSFSPVPSPSSLDRVRESMPPSSPDEEAARALEALMWPHDLDSVVSGSSLEKLRERYYIPEEFVLVAPDPGQRSYDPVPRGFALTQDALEAGLRLPLHPLIVSCLSLWRISPSQVTPNSWRYLVAFLGECYYANITPTRNLFLSCFRLLKGPGGYFVSARTGFRVGGAPSSNKGWKGRFFYVSWPRDWGFGVRWAVRVIDNTVPDLNDEECRDLKRLRAILPGSQAIRAMTEEWLAEAGLSPAFGGMKLLSLRGGRSSSASSPRQSAASPPRSPADPVPGSAGAPLEIPAGRPSKKARTTGPGKNKAGTTPPTVVGAKRSTREEGPSRFEGPSQGAAGKRANLPTVDDLCGLRAGADEPLWAAVMGELPTGEASDPLVARWKGLSRGDRVWAGGDPSAAFLRGVLHPDLARDLYTLPSETMLSKAGRFLTLGLHYSTALMDRVRDAGQIIWDFSERNSELCRQLEEIRAGSGPEAVAAAEKRATCFEEEVARLRAELERSGDSVKELQEFLRLDRAELRQSKSEALGLSKRAEKAEAEARAASEALAEELRLRPSKDKEAIDAYKKSENFELGLTRMGRVSYEYGYRIALGRFGSCPPGSEVERDPFASHPVDLEVDMPEDVPFDDRPKTPGEE
ncbi:uncharacterized protein LOC135636366 [Musa acuminata AAA Group]|uniref:uncharacterized protein LOC135636366 n=1 Tax=Musa acuminata AAA Group TaxID=214697 RepID=UPI0031DECA24